MLFLENLKYMKLYKKKFYLPIDMKDKKHGSVIMLLSPNYETSKFMMNYPLAINKVNSYQSYYIEKDILYTIQNETGLLQVDHEDYTQLINEQPSIFTEVTNSRYDGSTTGEEITAEYCRIGNKMIFFNEMYDEDILMEETNYNARYKTLLYNDRIRNNKTVFQLYNKVKEDNPWIKKTFINLARYNKLNLFDDLYYYHQVFMNNNTFTALRTIKLYTEFIRRFLMDKRIDRAGYTNKTIFIPIDGWDTKSGTNIYDYNKNINPYSMIFYALKYDQSLLRPFGDMEMVFLGQRGYFKAKMSDIANGKKTQLRTNLMRLINKLITREAITEDDDEPDNSEDGITNEILDKLETNKGIIVHNLTGSNPPDNKPASRSSTSQVKTTVRTTGNTIKTTTTVSKAAPAIAVGSTVTAAKKAQVQSKEEKEVVKQNKPKDAKKAEENIEKDALKQDMVDKIRAAAKGAKDEDEALDKLESDKQFKQILLDLQDSPDEGVKISAARASRIAQNQDALLQKQINGKSVKDMINESNKPEPLPETALPIKTINDEWKHLKAVNFEKTYDLDADIVKCLNSLSDSSKEYPVTILNIETEDTSTSEDSVITWTVKCEDYTGKQFTLKFDIPKLRDNRFMRLRGNEKIFSIEMPLIPVSKTDSDTVQICSFYNKIFVETYYTSKGRTNPYSNRLIKALSKYTGKDIEVSTGDNTKICAKYDLPIDYIDLAGQYSTIEVYGKTTKDTLTIYFNQDDIRSFKEVDPTLGIPVGRYNNGTIAYFDGKNYNTISECIASLINSDAFQKLYQEQSDPKKSTYSRAHILNTDIPIIVILSHDIGLTKAMDLAGITYNITEKKDSKSDWDYIKFQDAYIYYKPDYCSMMLMNGLKDCDTEDISIKSINSKMTWVDALDSFGGRIKSDGLDNFKQLMYDPVTIEVSKSYGLPDNYHEALIYASNLLVDNKYAQHTDISTNRYRTNEVIAAQFYRVLSTSYREYAMQQKHGRRVSMSLKQSAVIDMILAQNTTSDLSVFQPLYEIEAKNTISTKGVTGMNSDRAYQIDKRGYDDSMVNILAQATGFSTTVGVNRQTTINPNIEGGRGYFEPSGVENMNVVNTYGMNEALNPFSITSDDPFRNLLMHAQLAKHGTPTEYSTPPLITTGADAAVPYLTSDMFAYKAKQAGKVTEKTDKYMIVEYKDGTKDYVNLDEQTMKNSDGGFYISLQLVSDLKVGSSVKQNQVLAYDKKSFSDRVGEGQLCYNVGCLMKTAILSTEDGYEDSGACSEWMSEVMASDIVVMKDVSLPASTNVLQIAKKGQAVKEGDPILIFQNAYDEEDANILLKNLNADDGDISEIGRNVVKSKVTGVLSDIKIYRTCDTNEMSDSLKKIVTNYERDVNRLKRVAKDSITNVQLPSSEKLPQTGKTKDVENGVLIEFYMKYHDKLGIGDKISNGRANKNVIMNVYPSDEAPYTDYRRNEPIDDITSAASLDGRIITSVIKEGALNKALIELSRQVCEIYNIPWKNLHEIYNEDKFKEEIKK